MDSRSNLSQEKTELSQAKRMLLENRLRGRNLSVSEDSVISKRGMHYAPLSMTQQRLWLLYQLDPGSPSYNYSTALRLTGKLNVPVLKKCINEIIRRHEVLRTTIAEINGQPTQIVVSEITLPFQIYDLSQLPESHQETESVRLAKEEGKKPFDLLNGPLLRVVLIRLGKQEQENEWMLLFTVHHIAYDGWSAGVLLREFGVIYQSFLRNDPSPLQELPIQYADFSYWQLNWIQGRRLDQQLAYWKKQLADCPRLLDLPTDHSRPSVRSFQGATYTFAMSPELIARLHNLSRLYDVTLFTVLLAVFKILLFRYSGEKDICVGVPMAGRTKPALENLIGFFVNTVVIRTKIDDNSCVKDLIKQIMESTLEAQENQDIPFDKLVEELQPQRNSSSNPFFQVMFVMHNVPMRALELPSLTLEKIELDYEISKFDLVLHVTERGGLEGTFEYNTELFERASIVRIAEHLEMLLEAIPTLPDLRLCNLPLLTESEVYRLTEWNATAEFFPEDQCLHTLFEAQALKHPERTAVACGGKKLSYAELNERANCLARHLRKCGVGPEIQVALCVERSVEAVIGLIGILKAGGVYVPMDPSHPAERIVELLADCNASLLLTQDRLLTRFTENIPEVMCIDSDLLTDPERIDDDLQVAIHPLNAAYIIYTSGSTGKPKGVVISHKNAVASTYARFSYYPEQPDSFLLLSPFAFDSSIAGIFWTLSSGGRLCIPPEGDHQDPNTLVKIIDREELSHILCSPSFYSFLLDYAKQGQLNSLRTAIVAGEICTPTLAATHLSHLPTTRLYNEYGPTEATVWSSVYEIDSIDTLYNQRIPIGHPIANIQLYILDDYLNRVPPGVPGEIYIGGTGIARGYYYSSDMTADRFIPNPFSGTGARIYRTGDKARFLPDGNIEFLGRVDHQVKIRGFRIELSEIETRLLRHPQVKDAVVIAYGDQTDVKLAAYIVPSCAVREQQTAGESKTLFNELRDFLKNALPNYMVPAAFIGLDKLPLNSNGKIDASALPIPDLAAQISCHYVAPCTSLEAQLAELWASQLGIEQVGTYDNFFDLGGHSLSVVQIIKRMREFHGIDLSVTDLFNAPTVSEMSHLISLRKLTQREMDEVDAIFNDLVEIPKKHALQLLDEIASLRSQKTSQ
ncbi:amino acid adenylation domain-containing protein [Methylotuvimicrobium sp. KM2]|uniref:non-ribosomal peptide synthetase n=1 Tax=Methylotuvimicrobium sp. KM2 TaxID=3133976 RepID=UPI00310140FE